VSVATPLLTGDTPSDVAPLRGYWYLSVNRSGIVYDSRVIGAIVRRLHLPGKWRSIGPKSNTYIHLIDGHRHAEVISDPNRENTIKSRHTGLVPLSCRQRRLELPLYRLKLVCSSCLARNNPFGSHRAWSSALKGSCSWNCRLGNCSFSPPSSACYRQQAFSTGILSLDGPSYPPSPPRKCRELIVL
jgi:hypothetical protein